MSNNLKQSAMCHWRTLPSKRPRKMPSGKITPLQSEAQGGVLTRVSATTGMKSVDSIA